MDAGATRIAIAVSGGGADLLVVEDDGIGMSAADLAHTVSATFALPLVDLAAHPEVDAVMAAIVGAAGLRPCMAAARAGKRVLLCETSGVTQVPGLFHAMGKGYEAVEVAPGVLWLRMPLGGSLQFINVWALRDGECWAIVDTGLQTRETSQAWRAGR